jgi:hypothetical protein
LNHMWKSPYGRYGHYVDYGLMGPWRCFIIYLLNYPYRLRGRNEPQKIETKYVRNSLPTSLYLSEVKGCEMKLFNVCLLHTMKWWLVFNNY